MSNGKKQEVKKSVFDPDGWVEMEVGVVKFVNKGDFVQGIFKGFKDLTFGGGIVIQDGHKDLIVPLPTTLQGRFSDDDLNCEIAIVYTGMEKPKSGGREFKSFKVYKRPEKIF